MKKSLFIIATFVFIFCACSKETHDSLLTIDSSTGTVSFRATFEGNGDPDTKLGINVETGALTWATGDQIAIQLTNNNFKRFSYTPEDGGKFTCTLEEGESILDGGVAYYPATIAINGKPESVSLPSEYDASVSAGIAKVCPPMMATVRLGEEQIGLKHLGGILSVSANRVPADATQLVLSVPNRIISGDFAITEDHISSGTDSDDSVILTFDAGAFGVSAAEFFVPVPVTSFSEGFTIDFKNALGESLYSHSTTRTDISVARKSIKRMKEVTVPVSLYLNTTTIWWDDTNQYIHVVQSDDASKYYTAWPGTNYSISSTKNFTHNGNKYFRVIEDLGSMTGKTANIIVNRGYDNGYGSPYADWPYGDLYRATLTGINLTEDVYVSVSNSTSTNHTIIIHKKSGEYQNVWGWHVGGSNIWNTSYPGPAISALSWDKFGDNNYNNVEIEAENDSQIVIRGVANFETPSAYQTNDQTITINTGWDYFVKFTTEGGNNKAEHIGFPSVVMTKD